MVKEENFKVQVDEGYYKKDYDHVRRFISYFYQIDLIRKLKPKKVLEIGIGNKTVYNYLKENGVNVTGCDFDKSLKPDKVGDVRDLPFKNGEFDCVAAYEILEHLPWNDFEKSLLELQRVSSKYVIISIPYSSGVFEFVLKFPAIRTLIKRPFVRALLRIPYFFLKHKWDGEHYWEMGKKGYPKGKIKSILKKYFNIVGETSPVLNANHYFFILKKK